MLFDKETPWIKRGSQENFDVTMGNHDGAETCELVGCYILSILAERINKKDTGLYRDDGLIILRNCNRPKTDKTRKDIIKIIKQTGFKIEIKTHLKEVDCLNVTFSLKKETHQPFWKENDELLYIHTSSNHPPPIIK